MVQDTESASVKINSYCSTRISERIVHSLPSRTIVQKIYKNGSYTNFRWPVVLLPEDQQDTRVKIQPSVLKSSDFVLIVSIPETSDVTVRQFVNLKLALRVGATQQVIIVIICRTLLRTRYTNTSHLPHLLLEIRSISYLVPPEVGFSVIQSTLL